MSLRIIVLVKLLLVTPASLPQSLKNSNSTDKQNNEGHKIKHTKRACYECIMYVYIYIKG